MKKVCSRCRQDKFLFEFSKDASTKDGLRSYCRACADVYWTEYRNKNREKVNAWQRERASKNRPEARLRVRKSHFKTAYGLTLEQRDEMRAAQQNKCLICLNTFSFGWGKQGPAVDHCHATGKVRGLLCPTCNNLLGRAKDSVEILQRAIQYLQKVG